MHISHPLLWPIYGLPASEGIISFLLLAYYSCTGGIRCIYVSTYIILYILITFTPSIILPRALPLEQFQQVTLFFFHT
jgi:hypothetical protein